MVDGAIGIPSCRPESSWNIPTNVVKLKLGMTRTGEQNSPFHPCMQQQPQLMQSVIGIRIGSGRALFCCYKLETEMDYKRLVALLFKKRSFCVHDFCNKSVRLNSILRTLARAGQDKPCHPPRHPLSSALVISLAQNVEITNCHLLTVVPIHFVPMVRFDFLCPS